MSKTVYFRPYKTSSWIEVIQAENIEDNYFRSLAPNKRSHLYCVTQNFFSIFGGIVFS